VCVKNNDIKKDAKAPKKSEKTRKEKVLVDIEQRFEEKSAPRNASFRGGNNRRGGNDRRGGRGGNSRRGGRSSDKSPAINIQDATAFPSLGA
jgi:plasminogen activator inhibitor 1 RNA-binding protein